MLCIIWWVLSHYKAGMPHNFQNFMPEFECWWTKLMSRNGLTQNLPLWQDAKREISLFWTFLTWHVWEHMLTNLFFLGQICSELDTRWGQMGRKVAPHLKVSFKFACKTFTKFYFCRSRRWPVRSVTMTQTKMGGSRSDTNNFWHLCLTSGRDLLTCFITNFWFIRQLIRLLIRHWCSACNCCIQINFITNKCISVLLLNTS